MNYNNTPTEMSACMRSVHMRSLDLCTRMFTAALQISPNQNQPQIPIDSRINKQILVMFLQWNATQQ